MAAHYKSPSTGSLVAFAGGMLLLAGCGQATPQATAAVHAGHQPTPSAAAAATLVAMPAPSAHAAYPPKTLADLVALAQVGLNRRLVGMEGGADPPCPMAWVKVREYDGTSPRQEAADLVQMAIRKHVFTSSCGGFVYGTTNLSYCNCYLGDHGELDVEREQRGPAPGKMKVTFSTTDSQPSPYDWQVIVDEPNR